MFRTAARADDDQQDDDESQQHDKQDKPDKKKDKKAKKDKKKETKAEKKARAKEKAKLMPEVSGYLQVTFQQPFDTDSNAGTNPREFRARRARVKVSGKLIKKVGYNLELDPLAGDFTELLRDAYVELKQVPYHDIRVGQQKTQFGYENLESSGKLYVVNRAEVSGKLARGQTTRDIGVGVIGEIPIGRGYSVEDAITVVDGAGQNVRENNAAKNIFGRLGGRFHCDDLGIDVRAGGSAGSGDLVDANTPDPLDDERFTFRRYGADLEVDYTYAFVAAEVVTGTDKNIANDVETTQTGWYVLAAGKTPWHAGPVVRYDTLESYQRVTVGGYWGEVSDRLRAMVEYEHRKDKDDRLIVWTQGRF